MGLLFIIKLGKIRGGGVEWLHIKRGGGYGKQVHWTGNLGGGGW